jgi:hypothetical protein
MIRIGCVRVSVYLTRGEFTRASRGPRGERAEQPAEQAVGRRLRRAVEAFLFREMVSLFSRLNRPLRKRAISSGDLALGATHVAVW